MQAICDSPFVRSVVSARATEHDSINIRRNPRYVTHLLLDGLYTFDNRPNRLTKETEEAAKLNQIERAVAQMRFGAIDGNFDSLSQYPV
jgi:hypothetical protein